MSVFESCKGLASCFGLICFHGLSGKEKITLEMKWNSVIIILCLAPKQIGVPRLLIKQKDEYADLF